MIVPRGPKKNGIGEDMERLDRKQRKKEDYQNVMIEKITNLVNKAKQLGSKLNFYL